MNNAPLTLQEVSESQDKFFEDLRANNKAYREWCEAVEGRIKEADKAFLSAVLSGLKENE